MRSLPSLRQLQYSSPTLSYLAVTEVPASPPAPLFQVNKAILICFYGELSKIILQLSSNTLLICSSVFTTSRLISRVFVNFLSFFFHLIFFLLPWSLPAILFLVLLLLTLLLISLNSQSFSFLFSNLLSCSSLSFMEHFHDFDGRFILTTVNCSVSLPVI